jgi:hypothetical protein
MDSTFEYATSIPDVSPGDGPFPLSEHTLAVPRKQPHPRLSLRCEAKIAISGTLLGIAIHVLYVIILVLMPLQSTGAAKFGERFADFW